MKLPDGLQGSLAVAFLLSQGREFRQATEPNIEVEICPYCKKNNFHLRMEVQGDGADEDERKRDGLHHCLVCGKGGNLNTLKQALGVSIAGMDSRKEFGQGGQGKADALPDVQAAHDLLLSDEDAMDYLVNGRGFSREIIERMKIGVVAKHYFRDAGEVKALIYPYLVNGNAVFVHYRTLPTMPLSENKVPKAFSSPAGWAVPLYNGEILNDASMKEVIFVEGEPNTIAAMDHGVENICGVPGANFKKAEWLDLLNKLERVYICYDKDKVGQKAAQTLATRIGIEKCWKLVLPDFDVTTESGELRKGKDLNEWFVSGGGTSEAFETLKRNAVLFDVDGVASSVDSLQEFEDELNSKEGAGAKYKTPWDSLSALVGIDEGDVIDILAPEKIGKTTFAMNLVEFEVATYGEDAAFICLEMTRAKMTRKWVSHKAGVADNVPKTVAEGIALKDAFLTAIPAIKREVAEREGDLYFCYPKYEKVEDIYNLIRDIIRRYGVKWIVIDNLQRLCDTTLGSKNRTEHLSQISKVLSQIAKDYNVQMIRILQPHRIGVGKMVTTDNVDGASQIAKDCDAMITLFRNRVGEISAQDFETIGFVQTEASFSDDTLVSVGLSRYSSGGYTTLHCNGATSTFCEKTFGQIQKMQVAANANVGHNAQLNALHNVLAVPPADAEAPQSEGTPY